MRRILTTLACLLLCSAALLAQRVTVGRISFDLAPDYSLQARSQLQDGEACLITPKTNPNNDRLILKILPDALEGINGLTNEEVAEMLSSYVDNLAGVLADKKKSGNKLSGPYKIHFEDGESGYYPHCYSYVNGTDKNGKSFLSYTEAVIVNRKVISGCAIAHDEGELMALTEILHDAALAAE